ncbi:MSCRAMM family protein [Pseudoalteromonas sp. T1lg65]|uniref:MSCRAMM family protein n=1 Tax=Pseudoalteromonas sp. T1lg65 TaxID=2077101 RepID=UPI003F791A9A
MVLTLGLAVYAKPCEATPQKQSLQQLLERVQRVKEKLQLRQSAFTQERIAVGTELFLSAHKGNLYLGEIIAVTAEQGVKVELQSFFAAVGFAIYPQAEHRYEGWFFQPENTFSLDMKTGIVEINGERITLTADEFQLIEDEVFISDVMVNTLFDVRLLTSTQDLSVKLLSKRSLPIEAQQRRHAREVSASRSSSEPTLPWKPSPYQTLGRPVIDGQLRMLADNDENNISYSVLGAQDFVNWQASYFLYGRKGDLFERSQIALHRADPGGKALSVGTFTEVSVGDVQATQIGANMFAQQGRGVRFSDRPLTRPINNQRILISGPVQVGWDVELYRNGLLIAQQNNIEIGRYEFENVDLLYGENVFELVMYGEQGQVVKETQTYYTQQNAVKKGRGFYEVSLTEIGKSVFGDEQYTASNASWQLNGRYDYGLTEDLAVYAGYQHIKGKKNFADEQYVTAGVSANLNKSVLLDVDFNHGEYDDFLALNVRTKLLGQQISSRYEIKRDKETNNDAERLNIQMLGDFMLGQMPKVAYRFEYNLFQNELQADRQTFQSLFSIGNHWGRFSNQLTWRQVDGNNSDLEGYFRWQRRIFGIYSRMTARYDIQPEAEFQSLEAELSKQIAEAFDLNFTHFNDSRQSYRYNKIGISWNHDDFRLFGDFKYDSNDDWNMSISSQFSIGTAHTLDDVFITSKRLSRTGSLMVKAFVDDNNNGYYDEGEKPLPEVVVRARQNFARGKTDENGIVLLPSMVNYKKTDIVIEPDSIPDPFLIPASEGFSFTPRPGFIEYAEIPFVHSSEIEGVVELTEEEGSKPLGFTSVSLYDSSGKEVARTKTAYDGFYYFVGLKPGTYRAAVSDAEKLSISSKEIIEVELSANGDVLLDVNHQLTALKTHKKEFAVAGRFNTLSILKVYAAILAKRYPGILSDGFRYAKKNSESEYLLILAHPEERSAAKICQALSDYNVACNLETLTIYGTANNETSE